MHHDIWFRVSLMRALRLRAVPGSECVLLSSKQKQMHDNPAGSFPSLIKTNRLLALDDCDPRADGVCDEKKAPLDLISQTSSCTCRDFKWNLKYSKSY
jgi:hypothetical protein